MRIHLLAAPLTIAALALAGCGGSDDDKGPTKADYVAKADAICKTEGAASQKAATEAVAALGAEPTDEQIQTIATETIIPGLETQVTNLKALDKPDGDGEEIDAIYAALDTAIAAAKEDPSTVTGGEGANPFADANKKAVAYGLKECGSE